MDPKEQGQSPAAAGKPQVPQPSTTPVAPGAPAQSPQGKTPSEAPNASFATGTGDGSVGYDSPPITSSQLANPDVQGTEHDDPFYPPGGEADTKSDAPKSKEPENTGTEGSE